MLLFITIYLIHYDEISATHRRPRANQLATVCVIAMVVSFNDKTKIRTVSSMLPIHPARLTERSLYIEINNFIRPREFELFRVL